MKLLVLSGPPGAGKSTVAQWVADAWPRSVHLVADTFWHHVRGGYVSPWLPEAHDQNQVVMEAVAASAYEFSAGGYGVIVDGVVGPWLLDPFRRRVAAHVDVHYVVLRPDEQTALARAISRGAPALVEAQPLRHMYAQFASLGAYEPHVIDTTALSIEASAERVLDAVAKGSHQLSRIGSTPI